MPTVSIAARGLKEIEGRESTLRLQRNSQDSVHVTDERQMRMFCRELDLRIHGNVWEAILAILPEDTTKVLKSCVRDERPSSDAIKAATRSRLTPGTQVRRGVHLLLAGTHPPAVPT